MTRHRSSQPESPRSGVGREPFSLSGTLDHYEVIELSPREAGELLAHLRRSALGLSALPLDLHPGD